MLVIGADVGDIGNNLSVNAADDDGEAISPCSCLEVLDSVPTARIQSAIVPNEAARFEACYVVLTASIGVVRGCGPQGWEPHRPKSRPLSRERW